MTRNKFIHTQIADVLRRKNLHSLDSTVTYVDSFNIY